MYIPLTAIDAPHHPPNICSKKAKGLDITEGNSL